MSSDDGSVTGIWVAAVAAGSVASEAGLEAGDLLTELNGLRVASDGTMSDYCDILASAGADGAIDASVVRTTTGEVLEGEINGSSPLSVVGTTGGAGGGEGTVPTGETQVVTSSNGTITAEAPAEWDVDVSDDGFNVAPDVAAFNSSFTVPGVTVQLLEGEARRRTTAGIQPDELGFVQVVNDRKEITAQPASGRLDEAEHRIRSDRRVDRAAAADEQLQGHLRGQGLARGRQGMRGEDFGAGGKGSTGDAVHE